MTKKEFISSLLTSVEGFEIEMPKLSSNQLEAIMMSALYIIDSAVAEGNTVCLGEGRRFKQVIRKARTARNPRTQEKVEVPEKRYVQYRKALG